MDKTKEYDPDMDIERALLEKADLRKCECCNRMFKSKDITIIRIGKLDFNVCGECAELLGKDVQ